MMFLAFIIIWISYGLLTGPRMIYLVDDSIANKPVSVCVGGKLFFLRISTGTSSVFGINSNLDEYCEGTSIEAQGCEFESGSCLYVSGMLI